MQKIAIKNQFKKNCIRTVSPVIRRQSLISGDYDQFFLTEKTEKGTSSILLTVSGLNVKKTVSF